MRLVVSVAIEDLLHRRGFARASANAEYVVFFSCLICQIKRVTIAAAQYSYTHTLSLLVGICLRRYQYWLSRAIHRSFLPLPLWASEFILGATQASLSGRS